MQEELQVQAQQEHSKELPFLELNDSSQCLMNTNLHYLTMKGIHYIAETEAPEVFQNIKHFSQEDIDEMGDILSKHTDMPSRFLEALSLVLILKDTNFIEQLVAEGFEREGTESDGELLCRLYSLNNSLFRKLVMRLESTVKVEDISYDVSTITKPLFLTKNFFESKRVRELITSRCKAYYDKAGYTDHCLFKVFKHGNREGIVFERGSNPRSMAVLVDGERRNRVNNERKMDSIYFDSDSRTLWVNASGKRSSDIVFLKELFAEALTGDKKAYLDFRFNFDFLRDDKLKDILLKNRTYAQKILLKEACFAQESYSCISSPLKTAPRSRNECLTSKDDFITLSRAISRFNGVVLKLVFNKEGNSDYISVKSGKITFGPTLKIENVMELLSELKILQGHYDA